MTPEEQAAAFRVELLDAAQVVVALSATACVLLAIIAAATLVRTVWAR